MKNRKFSTALWVLNCDADFEHEGIQGDASFTGNGVDLVIPMGCLLDREPVNGVTIHNADPIEAPAAFGFCQTGERITLIDLSTPGPGFSAPGTEREDLRAASAIVCKTAFLQPNPVVRSLTLKVSGLWRWTGEGFGKVESRYKSRRWMSTSAIWSSEDCGELPLFNKDGVEITLQPVITKKGGHLPRQEFSVKEDVHLRFEIDDNPMPLDSAMDKWVYPMWKMLTFCMGFRCSIDVIKIQTADGHGASCFLPLIEGEEEPGNRQLDCMPLPYSYISKELPDIFERWLNLDGDARRAATILIGVQGNKGISLLDSMFATISGAFEAVSRVGEKTKDIENSRYKRIVGQLKKCLSNQEDADWVVGKLNNIPPASYYANALMKKLGVFSEYVTPDKERFLRDLRHNRNAYIHQTSTLDDKSKTLSDMELYSLAMAIKVLCYGAIMTQLGLDASAILKQFKATHFCQTEVHLARKMYSLQEDGINR